MGNDPLNRTDPTGKFCESASTCAGHRETIDRAQGKISPEQVRANETARGVGAVVGLVAVAVGVAAVELAPIAGPAMVRGLAPLAESVVAEGAAARTVGNAVASNVRGAVSQVAKPGTIAALMELGADAHGATAVARNVAGAPRVVELAKAGAIQQEIRAGIAESRAAIEKAAEYLKQLVNQM